MPLLGMLTPRTRDVTPRESARNRLVPKKEAARAPDRQAPVRRRPASHEEADMIASTLIVTLCLLSQAPAAQVEAAPADPAATPAPGYLYSEVGNGPDVGIAPTA